MGRKTGFNKDLSKDYENINPKNKELVNDYIQYCYAMDKSKATMITYTNQLKIFMCWNYKYNKDKFFIDLKSKDFVAFIGYMNYSAGPSNYYTYKIIAVVSALLYLIPFALNTLKSKNDKIRPIYVKISSILILLLNLSLLILL